MGRLSRIIATIMVVGTTTAAVSAQTEPRFMATNQNARISLGSIRGTVSDDRGGPLSGAMVSALGVTTAMVMTDARGRFALDALPPGEYIVRVHLAGFLSTRRDNIRVGPLPAMLERIQLRRVDRAVGTSGANDGTSHPLLAAGLDVPPAEGQADDNTDDHPHSELAWRLRHLKRSVLKDTGEVVSRRRVRRRDAARGAELDFRQRLRQRGEHGGVVLHRSSVHRRSEPADDVGDRLRTADLSSDSLPRGVAYVSIGAPMSGGEWAVRGSMSQSDLSSWILAGSFASSHATSHDYGFGVSYSTQQYQARTLRPLTLDGSTDDSRTVGEMYGSDRWAPTGIVAIEYGGRYAHYDYLSKRSLLSPRLGIMLSPFDENTHVSAVWSSACSRRAPKSSWPRRPSVRGCRPSGRSHRWPAKTCASSAAGS